MTPVKSKPRFRCGFCRYQATEPTVAKHERICWRNPDRHCATCDNKGYVSEWAEVVGGGELRYPCPYCERFNPEIAVQP